MAPAGWGRASKKALSWDNVGRAIAGRSALEAAWGVVVTTVAWLGSLYAPVATHNAIFSSLLRLRDCFLEASHTI